MNASIRRLAHTSLFALATALLFACGGGDDGGNPPPPQPPPASPPAAPPPAAPVVGPAGGTHTINGVTISVPANALSSTITLTVQPATAPLPSPTDGTPTGLEFEIGPAGTTFAQPVTVTLPLDSSAPQADSEPVLLHGEGATWVELPSQTIGAAAVSATTTTFSAFRLFRLRLSPLIVRDPANVSVAEPNVVSFKADVIGRRLSYQWERMRSGEAGFSAINVAAEPSAATSTYTTQATVGTPSATPSATEAADGTQYRLVVSNAAGTATSAAATLTVIQQPLLSVSVTGNGTVASTPSGISCGGDCSERYPLNSTVTLSATPDIGHTFSGFGGDPDCANGSLTMSAPRNCTATFVISPPASATLNVTVVGSGTVTSLPAGISCGIDCTEVYPLNQVVVLAVTPMAGNTFSGWSGDADCADASVTMSAARSCTATFAAVAVAPVIVSGPRNKTLVEGLVATFSVSATGSPLLSYVWERSNNNGLSWFGVGANSASYTTLPTSSASASAGGDHFAQFRVKVSNPGGMVQSAAVTLSVLGLASAVDVYVQHFGGIVRSKTLATSSGADYAATAEWATGQFAATVSVTAAVGDAAAYSGTFPIRFINNTGAPVTIPAGALRASFSGIYALQAPTVTQRQSSITSELLLTVSGGSVSALARFIHQVSNVDGITAETAFTPIISGGGSVMAASHGTSGLSGELLMPAIVLPAGGEMTVQLLLTTIVRRATANFTTVPVQLTLDLPPGITLDDNSAVDPLLWVI